MSNSLAGAQTTASQNGLLIPSAEAVDPSAMAIEVDDEEQFLIDYKVPEMMEGLSDAIVRDKPENTRLYARLWLEELQRRVDEVNSTLKGSKSTSQTTSPRDMPGRRHQQLLNAISNASPESTPANRIAIAWESIDFSTIRPMMPVTSVETKAEEVKPPTLATSPQPSKTSLGPSVPPKQTDESKRGSKDKSPATSSEQPAGDIKTLLAPISTPPPIDSPPPPGDNDMRSSSVLSPREASPAKIVPSMQSSSEADLRAKLAVAHARNAVPLMTSSAADKDEEQFSSSLRGGLLSDRRRGSIVTFADNQQKELIGLRRVSSKTSVSSNSGSMPQAKIVRVSTITPSLAVLSDAAEAQRKAEAKAAKVPVINKQPTSQPPAAVELELASLMNQLSGPDDQAALLAALRGLVQKKNEDRQILNPLSAAQDSYSPRHNGGLPLFFATPSASRSSSGSSGHKGAAPDASNTIVNVDSDSPASIGSSRGGGSRSITFQDEEEKKGSASLPPVMASNPHDEIKKGGGIIAQSPTHTGLGTHAPFSFSATVDSGDSSGEEAPKQKHTYNRKGDIRSLFATNTRRKKASPVALNGYSSGDNEEQEASLQQHSHATQVHHYDEADDGSIQGKSLIGGDQSQVSLTTGAFVGGLPVILSDGAMNNESISSANASSKPTAEAVAEGKVAPNSPEVRLTIEAASPPKKTNVPHLRIASQTQGQDDTHLTVNLLTNGAGLMPPQPPKGRRRVGVHEVRNVERAANFVLKEYPKAPEELEALAGCIDKCTLFTAFGKEEREKVITSMFPAEFPAGYEILTQGLPGKETFFLIINGQAEVLKDRKVVVTLGAGEYFGELELMYHTDNCAATIKCVTPLITYALEKATYGNIVLNATLARRKTFLDQIQLVDFFKFLSDYDQMRLAEALSVKKFERDQFLIRCGEQVEYMYIIMSGKVSVIGRNATDPSKREHIIDLGEGNVVGELEFLFQHNAVADVVAVDSIVTAAKLSRTHFMMIMGDVATELKSHVAQDKYQHYLDQAGDEVRQDVSRAKVQRKRNRRSYSHGAGSEGDTTTNDGADDQDDTNADYEGLNIEPAGELVMAIRPVMSSATPLLGMNQTLNQTGNAGPMMGASINSAYTNLNNTSGTTSTMMSPVNASFGMLSSSPREAQPVFARFPAAVTGGDNLVLIVIQEDGTIIHWNSVIARLTQFRSEDVVGQSIFSFLTNERQQKLLHENIRMVCKYAGDYEGFLEAQQDEADAGGLGLLSTLNSTGAIAAGAGTLMAKKRLTVEFAQYSGLYRVHLSIDLAPPMVAQPRNRPEMVLIVGHEVKRKAAAASTDFNKIFSGVLDPLIRSAYNVAGKLAQATAQQLSALKELAAHNPNASPKSIVNLPILGDGSKRNAAASDVSTPQAAMSDKLLQQFHLQQASTIRILGKTIKNCQKVLEQFRSTSELRGLEENWHPVNIGMMAGTFLTQLTEDLQSRNNRLDVIITDAVPTADVFIDAVALPESVMYLIRNCNRSVTNSTIELIFDVVSSESAFSHLGQPAAMLAPGGSTSHLDRGGPAAGSSLAIGDRSASDGGLLGANFATPRGGHGHGGHGGGQLGQSASFKVPAAVGTGAVGLRNIRAAQGVGGPMMTGSTMASSRTASETATFAPLVPLGAVVNSTITSSANNLGNNFGNVVTAAVRKHNQDTLNASPSANISASVSPTLSTGDGKADEPLLHFHRVDTVSKPTSASNVHRGSIHRHSMSQTSPALHETGIYQSINTGARGPTRSPVRGANAQANTINITTTASSQATSPNTDNIGNNASANNPFAVRSTPRRNRDGSISSASGSFAAGQINDRRGSQMGLATPQDRRATINQSNGITQSRSTSPQLTGGLPQQRDGRSPSTFLLGGMTQLKPGVNITVGKASPLQSPRDASPNLLNPLGVPIIATNNSSVSSNHLMTSASGQQLGSASALDGNTSQLFGAQNSSIIGPSLSTVYQHASSPNVATNNNFSASPTMASPHSPTDISNRLLRITVRDAGPGIPPTIVKRVLAFVNQMRKKSGKGGVGGPTTGTGLGAAAESLLNGDGSLNGTDRDRIANSLRLQGASVLLGGDQKGTLIDGFKGMGLMKVARLVMSMAGVFMLRSAHVNQPSDNATNRSSSFLPARRVESAVSSNEEAASKGTSAETAENLGEEAMLEVLMGGGGGGGGGKLTATASTAYGKPSTNASFGETDSGRLASATPTSFASQSIMSRQHLTLQQQQPQGTEFVITIPLAVANDDEEDDAAADDGTGGQTAANGALRQNFTTILVENSAMHRNMVCQLLWGRKHAVLPANGWRDVARMADAGTGEILIVDPESFVDNEDDGSPTSDPSSPDFQNDLSLGPIERLSRFAGKMAIIVMSSDFNDNEAIVGAGAIMQNGVMCLPKPCPPAILHNALLQAENIMRARREEQRKIAKTREAFSKTNHAAIKKIRLLGRGAFGEVHEVEDLITHGHMAMKTLQTKTEHDANEVLREIQAMTTLKHENIIHYIYCEKVDDRNLKIFMELASGGTISDKIKEMDGRGLPIDRIASYVRNILQGLAYIHKNRWVHCDIKPQNVLLDAEGRCKLGDFGTAVHLEHPGQVVTALKGTPSYMPPEVIEADDVTGQGFDMKADIWALGVTVMEMATGQPPWSHVEGAKGKMVMKYISDLKENGDAANLSPLFGCDPLIFEFVQACLNTDADARPSADQLLSYGMVSDAGPTAGGAGKLLWKAQLLHILNQFVAFKEETPKKTAATKKCNEKEHSHDHSSCGRRFSEEGSPAGGLNEWSDSDEDDDDGSDDEGKGKSNKGAGTKAKQEEEDEQEEKLHALVDRTGTNGFFDSDEEEEEGEEVAEEEKEEEGNKSLEAAGLADNKPGTLNPSTSLTPSAGRFSIQINSASTSPTSRGTTIGIGTPGGASIGAVSVGERKISVDGAVAPTAPAPKQPGSRRVSEDFLSDLVGVPSGAAKAPTASKVSTVSGPSHHQQSRRSSRKASTANALPAGSANHRPSLLNSTATAEPLDYSEVFHRTVSNMVSGDFSAQKRGALNAQASTHIQSALQASLGSRRLSDGELSEMDE